METIDLTATDERLGFVDETNALIYPAVDVFRAPILTRAAMQVEWIVRGECFVCFPPRVDVSAYDIVRLQGSNGPVAALVLEADGIPEYSAQADNSHPGDDGDRDHEDPSTDDEEAFVVGIALPADGPEPVDLFELTKAQLLERASERGLTLSDRLTKQAIIDALTGD